MNWVKENKFLTGLLVVTLVGAGALGYLLFTAKAKYDEASGNFENQAAELSRLEHLPAYPDAQNVKRLEEQRQQHLEQIQNLQKELAQVQIPEEPLSPVAF